MDKQQTAITFLSIQLSLLEMMRYNGAMEEMEYLKAKTKVIQEAKEMEKEQIKSAFNIGEYMAHDYFYGNHECAENYYNETYGGNK